MSEKNVEMDPFQNHRVAWNGCSVLLDINDGDRLVFARLSAFSSLKIGNKNFPLQPLIGCPFGSLFQIENGQNGPCLKRVLSATQGNYLQKTEECIVRDEYRDNRKIVDNNTAQCLSSEDIDVMRRQGATGDEIVEALIANSSTFENKTLFSQEKYKHKKQKKYAPKILLRRPFARSICETYFKKYPDKIGYIRSDTLSLILSMANVGAYSDVLVVDMVGGILTGAVAERLGGTGYVCNVYLDATPHSMDIVRIFNLSKKCLERIVRCPISDLLSATNGTVEEIISVTNGVVEENEGHENEVVEMDIVEENTRLPQNEAQNSQFVLKPCTHNEGLKCQFSLKSCKLAKAGEKVPEEIIALWKENGFTSLIIAAPDMDPWNMIEDLLPLLSYSAPFVIYHQYLQPLATCMHNLQLRKMAIGMQISEPWLREYQVLPSRTHPCMQMSASGGYVLSGTRICYN